jgi:hypothetical protein
MLGDLAAKDHRDLLRLSDGSIGVEQTLTELVQGRSSASFSRSGASDIKGGASPWCAKTMRAG